MRNVAWPIFTYSFPNKNEKPTKTSLRPVRQIKKKLNIGHHLLLTFKNGTVILHSYQPQNGRNRLVKIVKRLCRPNMLSKLFCMLLYPIRI